MADSDKRKAEEALEGGPAKKAAIWPLAVNPKRVRELRKGAVDSDGPVIYWQVPRLPHTALLLARQRPLAKLVEEGRPGRPRTVLYRCCRMSRDQRVRDNW